MRGRLFGFVVAAVTVALTLILPVTSSAAPETGVDIVVTIGGIATTIDAPGCLNYDGHHDWEWGISVQEGFWVSNGWSQPRGGPGEWITLVSNGVGYYHFIEWPALHVCGGSTVDEALAELGKIDPNGVQNRRFIVNPVSATPTATQTRAPSPAITPTATVTRTTVPTSTPTATATVAPGVTSTPTATPTLGTFAHTLVVVKTIKGVSATIDTPGCLNYDPAVDKWVTQVTVLSGVWVSNGQEAVFGCDISAAGTTSVDCDAPWETLWGSGTGIYRLSWAGYHVCGGRSFEEALSELRKIDPGGASNPLRRVYPVRGLPTIYLPVVLK